MEKDIYLSILKTGKDALEAGKLIDVHELREILQARHNPAEEKQGEFYLFTDKMFNQVFTEIQTGNGKRSISMQAYFQLLEHDRLNEAREDSKKALEIAMKSLNATNETLKMAQESLKLTQRTQYVIIALTAFSIIIGFLSLLKP